MTGAAALWLSGAPLLLASGSTTRRDMLLGAGVSVAVLKAEIDERAVEYPLKRQDVPPDEIAAALARAKALAVSARRPDAIVLGADQTLACDGRSFHKPDDAAAARDQIAALSGRSHVLHSAFVLAHNGVVLTEGVETARLTMRSLSAGFIADYVALAGAATLSSVGGYQIEGLGAQLFERIEGDHFTILGLPLLAVLAALRDQGLLAR